MGRRALEMSNRKHDLTHCQPILVTENAQDGALHNGDLGILWRDSERSRAWFALPNGNTSTLGISRLPPHEPAYAMSVHKCQGSEVGEVIIILPDADSPMLTRELLYTAVTRARTRCVLVGTRQAVSKAVGFRVERRSGLAQAISPEAVGLVLGQGGQA